MAGTVPAPLGGVEVHQATEVGAHGKNRMELTIVVAVCGDVLAADACHRSAASRQILDGVGVIGVQSVANEVPESGDVLRDKSLETVFRRHSGGVVDLEPWVVPASDEVGH